MNLLKLSFNLIIYLSFINIYSGFNSEYIKSFVSDISINLDGTINITETITVMSVGSDIRYGIYREFPTRYKDRYGNFYNTGFKLISTLIDNKIIEPEIKSTYSGYKIIIKNPELLSYGLHTFVIKYITSRQLGFFHNSQENFVEFYFNITGNSWKFPIFYACANITLPKNLPLNLVNVYAYTGKVNGKDYSFNINNLIKIETTKPIDIGSGFTVAINWPHGYILEPTLKEKAEKFSADNILTILLLLCIILLVMLLIYFYIKKIIDSKKYTVIPLYNLPANLTPAVVRFISEQYLDNIAIAANVVYLAVHGFLTIDYKKYFLSSSYILTKLDKNPKQDLSGNLKYILDSVFSKASAVSLPFSRSIGQVLVQSVEMSLKLNFSSYFNNTPKNIITLGTIICTIFAFIVAEFNRFNMIASLVFALLLFWSFIWFIIFSSALKNWTDEGLKLKAQIDGFKMFLNATQEEFLKIVGSTPEQNPELYEKYLPYAMALGVEKNWNAKFAPYFKIQEAQKNIVSPYWHLSNSQFGRISFSNSFSSNFSKQFPTAPGVFSGSLGRGRSGGGGGGGGGGGC